MKTIVEQLSKSLEEMAPYDIQMAFEDVSYKRLLDIWEIMEDLVQDVQRSKKAKRKR